MFFTFGDHFFRVQFFRQHECWGSPFLAPLSVSTLVAGTIFVRPPPRSTRNTAIVVVDVVVVVVVAVVFSSFHFIYIYVYTYIYKKNNIYIYIQLPSFRQNIGTKIQMSKCFDHKITFPDTHRHFCPAIEFSKMFPIVGRGSRSPKEQLKKQSMLGYAACEG